METLITRSIEEAARRGLAEVSLGLAPLAITSGESDRVTDRALRQAYEHLDRFRRSRSLRQFKNKFAPRWEERYLVVPSAATLPQVLVALLRAHLPWLSPLSVRLRLRRPSSAPLGRPASA
jgi:phosphatidylglycerol lysyltransferase